MTAKNAIIKSENRLGIIDSLRGTAVLFVLFFHSSAWFLSLTSKGIVLNKVADFADFGRIGVILFFLISGFIIPSSLKTTPKSIQIFAIRRFFRLFPAYWISLVTIIPLYIFLLSTHIPLPEILANFTMLQQFLGQPHIEGLYWSLEVELVFYLVCVLMHSMGLLSKPGPLFIACIVFFLIFAVGQTASHKIMFISKLNENLLTRQLLYMPYLLSIMFVGSLYRKIFDYKENKSPKNIKFTSIFATLVCFGFPAMVLILSLFGINLNSSDSVKFGLSHLFALMIFAAGFVIFNKKAGLLAWFGKISYSLYLFQASAMVFLGYLVAKYHSLGGFHLGVYMSATFILSIGISAAVYYLIEKPAIDAGHRLTKKILTESKIQPEIVASTVQ